MKFRLAIGVSAVSLGALTCTSLAQGPLPVQNAQIDVQVPAVVSRSFNLGHANPAKILHIAVSMPYGNADGMQRFVDAVSDPSNLLYRQFITPEEVGKRFGLSSVKVQELADYLTANGIKVNLIAKNHLSILAVATVAQAEAAFHTKINQYQAINPSEAGNLAYYSNSTPLSVPSALAGRIIDVSGLDNFTKPVPRALTCTQTRTLYDLAPNYSAGYQGQGRNLAISNFDGYRLTNVPLYYSHFGLPGTANITEVKISGGAGTGTPQGEGDLDIQMVLGMSPACHFYIYDGGGSDLIGTLTREANDNIADVISESYGWSLPASTATSAHNVHLSMSAQGITYMAASGDSGTTIEPYSYPNYDPEVLIVGGTVATVDSNGNRTSEVGWSGSGGGWSTNAASFNTRPSWQAGTGVPTNINFRMGPDVSLHASSSTGAYQFYFRGSLSSGYIGTSFASPVFDGALGATEQKIIALGGLPANGAGKQRFGRIQDLFYSQNGRSDIWHDITSGSNGKLPNGSTSSCTAGWDMVTGWGPIDFGAFATLVAGGGGGPTIPNPPTNLIATAGNAQVALGWTGSAGATNYNVKRSTTSGGPYSTVGSTAGTTFTDSTVTNGTTYYYVATASNTAGESGNSNQASATPASGGAQQLLLNPGFESGAASWTATSSVINNTASEPAHSGSWKAWLNGYGRRHTDSVYQQVAIPSSVTTATLTFWLHIDTAETTGTSQNDTLAIQIRSASNTVLATLATYSNLDKSTGYVQKSFNLAAYKGQTIRVYLLGTENNTKQTSFVVDDFELNVQ
jgi:subtilase family serine protease